MSIIKTLLLGPIFAWNILHAGQLLAATDTSTDNNEGFIIIQDNCRLPIKEAVYQAHSGPLADCKYFSIDDPFSLEQVRSAVTIVIRTNTDSTHNTTVTIKTIKDKVNTLGMTFRQLMNAPAGKPYLPGVMFLGVTQREYVHKYIKDITVHMDR